MNAIPESDKEESTLNIDFLWKHLPRSMMHCLYIRIPRFKGTIISIPRKFGFFNNTSLPFFSYDNLI